MDYKSEIDLSKHTLDHKLIHEPLKIQMTFTINKLSQEREQTMLAQLLIFLLKIADNNYDAVHVLVTQSFKYGTPAMVICRSTMELVYTVALILSSPSKYLIHYVKAGWKEQYFELDQQKNHQYNLENAPGWINMYEQYLDFHAISAQVTEEERSNPNKIPYFPTPTQILSKKYRYLDDLDVLTKALLIAMDEGYYSGVLSKISHYSESGMAWQVGPMEPGYSEQMQQLHISQPVAISMMICLCLLSEVSIHFDYNNRAKLRELWTYLTMNIPLHERLYNVKYRQVL